MGHEVYRVAIAENDFQGNELTFKKVADTSFSEFAAIVFALEIEVKNVPGNKSIIRLNPSNFVFSDWHMYNYYLYIICEDEAVAKQVQKLDMSAEDYERYFERPRQPESKFVKVVSEKREF
jgi:hypothetical protein